MSDENRYAKFQADLHAAVSKVVNEHEGAPTYLMRFVVLAEIVDSNGERALLQAAADGMMRWDTLGLLDHARSVEWGASHPD